jgi:C4-dicarboxylate transporter DctM subunit
MFTAIDKFPLAAIPFFILAGNLMETGGISRRLVEFAKSLVGGVQGGLPMTCVLTCMIFAAVSGSSVATTFAIGAILIPALIKHGYPTPYAAALQATSAELGVIIPPSIPMILFGVSGRGVDRRAVHRRRGAGPADRLRADAVRAPVLPLEGLGQDRRRRPPGRGPATVKAGWALLMPVIILGGIYGGIFTPTEAAVVAVFYALSSACSCTASCTCRRPGAGPAQVGDQQRGDHVHHRQRRPVRLPDHPRRRARRHRRLADRGAADRRFWFLLGVNAALFVIGMFIETARPSSCWRRSWCRWRATSASTRCTSA